MYEEIVGIKRDTPSIIVKELTNCKSIDHILEEAQVKLWHKYKLMG